MIKKIISAGNPGVDRAAIDAAVDIGIPFVQGVPTLCKPEKDAVAGKRSRIDEQVFTITHNMEENIRNSDGTLILTTGELSKLLKIINELTTVYILPCLHIDLMRIPSFKALSLIVKWIQNHKIRILNIAGSDIGGNKKIYEKTYDIISGACFLSQTGSTGISDLKDYLFTSYSHQLNKTRLDNVERTIKALISELSLKDKVRIANLQIDEFTQLNSTFGEFVKGNLNPRAKNPELIQTCQLLSRNLALSKKDTAEMIIFELWKQLRKTHKLRIIK